MARQSERRRHSHRAILEAAARLLRQRGLKGAGVDAVMTAAGLTHGGFYAHFKSKAALLREALAEALAESRGRWLGGLAELAPSARVPSLLGRYLNEAHVADPASGCPLPLVAGEIWRQDSQSRKNFAAEIDAHIDALSALLPGGDAAHSRQQAIGLLALCVGGVSLARAVGDDSPLRGEILHASRALALRAHGREASETGQ